MWCRGPFEYPCSSFATGVFESKLQMMDCETGHWTTELVLGLTVSLLAWMVAPLLRGSASARNCAGCSFAT